VSLFRYVQQQQTVSDTLLLCMFVPYGILQSVDILAAVTGWNTSVTEVLKVGERVLTMARMFNVREGFTSDDDKLPERFFQPKTSGALSAKAVKPQELEKAKSYYYTLMGWDARTGVPTREKLEELDIGWVVEKE
jgi:aldehyde:ferredoxin oxidoreductase